MRRDDLLDHLSIEILSRKRHDRPLKVAIDGRCAAGKTVLADELASALRARTKDLQVLHPSVDGFHHTRNRRYRQGEDSATGYYQDAYDYAAVIDCILGPLSGTSFPVLCRLVSHDWRTDLHHDAPPILVGARSVLLFEGLFLLRRELDSFWDLRILLDVDFETSLARALDRDTGDSPPYVVRRKYGLRYEPAWQIYLREEHPESRADWVIDNREFLEPQILDAAPPMMEVD